MGTPAGYEPIHLKTHAWMLTGSPNETTDANFPATVNGVSTVNNMLLAKVAAAMALSTTPFERARDNVYDPYFEIDHIYDGLDGIKTSTSAPYTEWNTAVDSLKTKLDTILGTTDINNAVDSFELKARSRLAANMAQLAEQFAGINMLRSSAYVLGVAMLQREFERSVSDYEAQLKLGRDNAKTAAYIQNTPYSLAMQARGSYLQSALEAARMVSGLKRQHTDDYLQYDLKDTMWDIEVVDFIGKGIGAIGGAAVIPAAPNPMMEAVSSIASIGSVVARIFT